MTRTEEQLMTDWQFRFGQEEPQTIDLPHDWVNNAPFSRNPKDASQGFRVRRGTGFYKKGIQISLDKEKRYFLDFGGIYEKSTIYVNGKEAGGHLYGYTSFRLEVTELLRDGANEICVRVDSDVTPTDRWYAGSGIYRTVKLITTGRVYLDERQIKLTTSFSEDFSRAWVRVDTGLSGPLRGSLTGFGCECRAEGEGGLSFEIPSPALWSAKTPNLYTLTVKALDGGEASDCVCKKIGLRRVEFLAGRGMFINGLPVRLRGVCVHQDMGCMGIAAKAELWKERLLLLKEMGCNAIRPAHHLYSEEFLDLCDELGFYVYEEAFDKWTGGHYQYYFETEWKKDLDEMVLRDRNRPSVVIWGVGNEVENQGQPSMLRILKMLTERVRELDGSRPVTCAMNPHFKRESSVDLAQVRDIQQFVDEADDTEIWDVPEKIDRIKRIGELVDIISCNYQEQWYEQIHEAIPDKLILGTEIYPFFSGHYSQFKNFSQDNPSLIPERFPYVIGGMIWIGIDYLGESMGYPSRGSNGGLIRTNMERKAGYYLLQSYWSDKPMIHFSVLDYSLEDEGVKDHWNIPPYVEHWQFPQFSQTVIPYMIATNCEEAELYVNDTRIYVDRPEAFPSRMITGYLGWTPGRVTVIGKNSGKEVCRHVTVTPGPAEMLGFDEPLLKRVPAKRGYQLLLTVRAKDREGNPCFRESTRVRFRVEGPAKILGTDSGDAKSHERYEDSFIHLFRGQASVVVGLTGEPGRVSVFADGDGMRSGQAVICAE